MDISRARLLKICLLSALLAITVTAVAVALLSRTNLQVDPTATCLTTHCFCERVSSGLFAQLSDSMSSLAYVALGVFGLVRRRSSQLRRLEDWLVIAVMTLMVLIGSSSYFYHATLTFFGQFLDIFSMYLFGTLLILAALVRRRTLSVMHAAILFAAVNVVLAVVQYNVPDARRILFGLILVPGIVLEFLPRTHGLPRGRSPRFLAGGVGLLVVAYLLWLLDEGRIVCSPGSLLQGHAGWHVLTAVAIYLLALHYEQTASVELSDRSRVHL